MRRTTVVALTLAAVATAAVLGGPAADGGATANRAAADADPTLVSVGETRIWPYVAPDASFDRRASSLNVVILDDPTSVRRYLARDGGWNRTDGRANASVDRRPVLDPETVPWRDAPGATRYTYVAADGWLEERYQLHRGAYFGSRDHLRAYGPPGGDWTAVQAHAEHWDWFTITHTVDSVETAQRRVESEFLGDTEFSVRRAYYANGDTYDADGWTTVVALAGLPLVGRHLRRLAARRTPRRVALAGALAALPLAVRAGGLLFERHLPWLSPNAVVAVWYPVLVVGVPLAAYGLGRRLPAAEAGVLAGAGVGLGLVLDYAVLGISVLPIPVAVHRVGVVTAVALVAAGASGDAGFEWTPPLRAGAALWAVAVVAGHLV